MLPTYTLELRKSRRLGDQINLTFQYLRLHSRSLVRSMLLLVGPPVLLTGLFWATSLLGLVQTRPILDESTGQVGALVFGFISSILAQGVANEHVRLYIAGSSDEITVDAVWRAILKDAVRLLAANIVLWIVIVGVVLLVTLSRSTTVRVLAILVAVPAAVYLSIAFSILVPVCVNERIGIMDAISRCTSLIRGRWWSTFFLLSALGLVATYAGWSITMPAWFALLIVSIGRDIEGTGSDMSWLVTVITVLMLMISYLVTVVPTLGAALHYFNLVEKKDAVGLMARIDAIGTHTEPTSDSYYA